ncbi:hypothetical protein R5R35_004026 [Gryllus longicercus]|uniref:Uncharacterized protein n=1 Tax=Gryllus longicercus TaxID=2509291 RepID=A0AAN9Z9Q6_9ORTH
MLQADRWLAWVDAELTTRNIGDQLTTPGDNRDHTRSVTADASYVSLTIIPQNASLICTQMLPVLAAATALLVTVAHARVDRPAQYSYGYVVQDHYTGDSKAHHESRQGSVVRGSYTLVDPDGTRRTVQYVADPLAGFNAVVRQEPAHAPAVGAVPLGGSNKAASAAPPRIEAVKFIAPGTFAQGGAGGNGNCGNFGRDKGVGNVYDYGGISGTNTIIGLTDVHGGPFSAIRPFNSAANDALSDTNARRPNGKTGTTNSGTIGAPATLPAHNFLTATNLGTKTITNQYPRAKSFPSPHNYLTQAVPNNHRPVSPTAPPRPRYPTRRPRYPLRPSGFVAAEPGVSRQRYAAIGRAARSRPYAPAPGW